MDTKEASRLELLNLKMPVTAPTLYSQYPSQEICIIYNDGSVRVINTEVDSDVKYISLKRLQIDRWSGYDQFNTLFNEDEKLKRVLRNYDPSIKSVYVADN